MGFIPGLNFHFVEYLPVGASGKNTVATVVGRGSEKCDATVKLPSSGLGTIDANCLGVSLCGSPAIAGFRESGPTARRCSSNHTGTVHCADASAPGAPLCAGEGIPLTSVPTVHQSAPQRTPKA